MEGHHQVWISQGAWTEVRGFCPLALKPGHLQRWEGQGWDKFHISCWAMARHDPRGTTVLQARTLQAGDLAWW